MPHHATPRKRIAILLENQFEDSAFQVPSTALRKAGATVAVIGSRMNEEYQGKRSTVSVKPVATSTEVRAENFDAFVIPGGRIRANPNMVRLVTHAMEQDKLVAAVGYGPQILIEADQLRGKHATSVRSICTDLQNAGAIYVNEPVVVEGNLVTARQPSDLPMFTTMILKCLNLTITGTTLPKVSDSAFDWWKLGAAWGGSSRQDIIKALNTAIVGERYTLEAFMQYSHRVSDQELRLFLQGISSTKHYHVERLEAHLYDMFKERLTWQAVGSEAYAALQGWLQSSNDLSILRRALGDIQTGVIDVYHLCNQLTDPKTVSILEEVEHDLANHEQQLANLYHARSGDNVKPPMPTTIAAVF